MKYRVIGTKTIRCVTEIEAKTQQEAIAALATDPTLDTSDDTEECNETIIAIPLCPECGEPLTRRSVRETGRDEHNRYILEPSYCDTCDREVYDEEEEAAAANLDDRPF